uniref:Multifunctional methyltransferase subunit TRM112-like protein n=1 Tax=Plectus sambesii TaxID=2011161 RepID=A0A914WA77_9BILA
MKLLTHNFLSSKFLKGVTTGYPLLLVATQKEVKEHEFNADFVKRMLPKVDYTACRTAAESIGEAEGLPTEVGDMWEENEDFLRKLHRVLLEVEVTEGELQCPESGRKFPIKNGIPNMLANEDEVE